jgi:hypothetical protein
MNHRWLRALLLGVGLAVGFPASTAIACSPAFNPNIRELGPAQVVVLGTVGERVPGGRLFHVERWFNGGEPGTPIVIAFKEGEPIGDCSYPVATGERKIIAPWREPDGRLSADLGTLQADPDSADGRRYLEEAVALFGPGVVLEPAVFDTAPPTEHEPVTGAESATDGVSGLAVVAVGLALIGVIAGLLVRRAIRRRST